MMKQRLLKTIALGLMAMVGVNAWAQTTIVVKDQATSKGSTVDYADASKTVAYTNADDAIWYLGTYDLSTIDYIEVKGAAFESKGDGTKAQLRLAWLDEGTITDLTATGISAQSSTIRNDSKKLARITAETTPTTMADKKNCTHYPGADFKITFSTVTKEGTYDGTCTLEEGSNTFGLNKSTGTYQLFLYGNASSRRLAVDQIVIHYKGEVAGVVTGTITADTYVRKSNAANHGAEPTMELYTFKDETNDNDFVGLMSFTMPSYVVGRVTNASLKLVTERKKGAASMNVYSYSHNFAENTTYATEDSYITAARATTSTSFDVSYGVNNAALGSDDISAGPEIAKWTNTVNLTSYATAQTFNIMIAAGSANKNANKFYTKEATDVTNSKNSSYTYTAAELQPVLTITYGDPIPSKSYTLTVTSAGAATLMLPYETTIPAGVTCYKLSYSSGDNITATEVTEGTLSANTPVLVIADANDYTFNATSDVETLKTATNGVLTGVCAETIVPADNYILTKHGDVVAFRKANGTTNKVKPYRAYLTASHSAGAPEFLNINFGSDVTAIDAVEKKTVMDDGEIYNLQGVRMTNNNLPKGIYVKNGKKFVVK